MDMERGEKKRGRREREKKKEEERDPYLVSLAAESHPWRVVEGGGDGGG